MKPCPCGAIPTTSSDITYSIVWCGSCHKTLSRQCETVDEAILVYEKGEEALPPNCPFCHWRPEILDPDGDTKVQCNWGFSCPLKGQIFSLEVWNRCRPVTARLDALVRRWEKKKGDPTLKKAVRALKRAIASHVRQRFID